MESKDLITRVVNGLKTSAQLRPVVYAQFSGRGIESYPLTVLEGTGREKAYTLFQLGRAAARRVENNGRELIDSCLLTEIWFGGEELGGVRPINAPGKRREGVMFLLVRNQAPYTPVADLYEIKRQAGKVKELHFLQTSDEVQGLLAQSFTAGVRSLAVSDSELARRPFDPRPFLG